MIKGHRMLIPATKKVTLAEATRFMSSMTKFLRELKKQEVMVDTETEVVYMDLLVSPLDRCIAKGEAPRQAEPSIMCMLEAVFLSACLTLSYDIVSSLHKRILDFKSRIVSQIPNIGRGEKLCYSSDIDEGLSFCERLTTLFTKMDRDTVYAVMNHIRSMTGSSNVITVTLLELRQPIYITLTERSKGKPDGDSAKKAKLVYDSYTTPDPRENFWRA